MTTKRMMDKKGIKYEEVALQDNPEKLEEFRAQGFTSAPIVTTDIKIWSGFRFEKIESLAQYLHAERAVEGRQSAA
jgi:glutaredoxin-like protein NrdH